MAAIELIENTKAASLFPKCPDEKELIRVDVLQRSRKVAEEQQDLDAPAEIDRLNCAVKFLLSPGVRPWGSGSHPCADDAHQNVKVSDLSVDDRLTIRRVTGSNCLWPTPHIDAGLLQGFLFVGKGAIVSIAISFSASTPLGEEINILIRALFGRSVIIALSEILKTVEQVYHAWQ